MSRIHNTDWNIVTALPVWLEKKERKRKKNFKKGKKSLSETGTKAEEKFNVYILRTL
jgi:hypothetical protein